MSDDFIPPRGTLDWLPARQAARHVMLDRFRALCEGSGYAEVATPVFEEKSLFSRTAGESSEVVGKEMYLFEDQGERVLALRPEFTASLMRLYLGNGMSREAQPVRIWCAGSCYRYAAVQRGRYREFTQVDAEAIGSDDPAVDAELIALQLRWYDALGLEGVELRINTIGDRGDREPYLAVLREYLDAHIDQVDDEILRQRDLNPLRAFDTKDPASQRVMADAPKIADHVSEAATEHFAPFSMRAASRTPSIPPSCADSITTAARPGRSPGPSWARSPALAAADGTTGWPRRSVVPPRRASASPPAWSGCCSPLRIRAACLRPPPRLTRSSRSSRTPRAPSCTRCSIAHATRACAARPTSPGAP